MESVRIAKSSEQVRDVVKASRPTLSTATLVVEPCEWAHLDDSNAASELLIGEEMIKDDHSASLMADRAIAEVERLVSSDIGWKREFIKDGVTVESKDVHGAYGKVRRLS